MTLEEFEKFDVNHTVCDCFDVILGKLLEAIKSGHNTMDSLMNATDAGTGCERCQSVEMDLDQDKECHLEEILASVKEKGL
jgi:bacterioferritin-associated ferredoxin